MKNGVLFERRENAITVTIIKLWRMIDWLSTFLCSHHPIFHLVDFIGYQDNTRRGPHYFCAKTVAIAKSWAKLKDTRDKELCGLTGFNVAKYDWYSNKNNYISFCLANEKNQLVFQRLRTFDMLWSFIQSNGIPALIRRNHQDIRSIAYEPFCLGSISFRFRSQNVIKF